MPSNDELLSVDFWIFTRWWLFLGVGNIKLFCTSKRFFPMVPPMEFLFTLWYPKRSKNNYRAPLQNIFSWPILHSSMDIVEKDFENALFSIYILLITLWCRKMLRKLLKEGTYSREEIIPGSTVGRILSRK